MVVQSPWWLLRSLCECVLVWMCVSPAFAQWRKHFFVEQEMTQQEAHQHCLNQNATLSSVLSQLDQDQLKTTNPDTAAWIGLYKNGKPQNWVWTDGTRATYYNWKVGSPGDCGAVSRGGFWLSEPCEIRLPYICQSAENGEVTVSQQELPWKLAKVECEDGGMNLVTFRNAEAKLDQWPDTPHWMGLWYQDHPGPSGWKWVDSVPQAVDPRGAVSDEGAHGKSSVVPGEGLTYTNWKTNEFCARMLPDGKWEDESCELRHWFVCAKGTQYEMVNPSRTWQQARDYCVQQGKVLASIHNATENADLLSQAGVPHGWWWIGLSDQRWHWSGGSSADFFLWKEGQPDNRAGGEDCVITSYGEWYDDVCSRTHPFFCLKRPQLQLGTAPSSWEGALEQCRSQESWDLASLGHHDDNDNIDREQVVEAVRVAKTAHVWVGLRFLMGEWLWVNGDPHGTQHWEGGGGQEMCPSHHCGAIDRNTAQWVPVSCKEKLDFLCQKM